MYDGVKKLSNDFVILPNQLKLSIFQLKIIDDELEKGRKFVDSDYLYPRLCLTT